MKQKHVIFAALAIVVLSASSALANAGGELYTSDKLWNYAFRIGNFIIFAGLLWHFAGAKAKDFFNGRRTQIKTDLDDLTKRQADAEKKLKEVEASIANMAQEKQLILDQAKAQGNAMKEAIIAEARTDATALTEQAVRTAQSEAATAVDTIRGEMADMVIAAAEKIVQEKLTDQDHDKLVDEYLNKVVLN